MKSATGKKTIKKAKTTKKAKNQVGLLRDTIQKVNTEIADTVSYVTSDILESGQQVRDNAVKTMEQIDFKDSVERIKTSAEKVNEQIIDAAFNIADNVVNRSKKISEAATERTQEALEVINLGKGYETFRNTVKEVNQYSLETADELIELAKSNSKAWQKIMEKAIDGGIKLGSKQQEIVFDAMENVKNQVAGNAVRLVNIFTKEEK